MGLLHIERVGSIGLNFQFRAFPPGGFVPASMRDTIPPTATFSDEELGQIGALVDGADRLAMEVEAYGLDVAETAATLRALGIRPGLEPEIAALRRDRRYLPTEPTPEKQAWLDALSPEHQAIASRAMTRVAALRAAFDRAIARLEAEALQPLPAGRPLIDRAFEAYARALHNLLPIAPVTDRDVEVFRGEEGGIIAQMTLRPVAPIDPRSAVRAWREADRRVRDECPEAVGLFAYRLVNAESHRAA